jgi:hypothetical protein
VSDHPRWARIEGQGFALASGAPLVFAPLARRGTDPERDETFESGFLQQTVRLSLAAGGGFVDQTSNYSFGTALTFLPHILGSAQAVISVIAAVSS